MPRTREKGKVLFVHSSLQSFVKSDLEVLEKHFDVRTLKTKTFYIIGKGSDPLIFLRLLKGVLWADVVFCWFASTNAFFSVVFSFFLRKKTLVVVGGFDAAYVPEIGYGIFVNRWRRVLTNIAYRRTDKILVVDLSLKKDILRNSHLDIGNKIVVVPTGYDSAKWKPSDGERENLVLTVAGVKWSNVRRKGLETFVKAAKYLPNVRFVLIGKHYDDSAQHLKSISTSNVHFTGFISENELIRFYQRAKVYCQLSRYEGLPNSLCEAMLCSCIPVGTRYCGIPTAIGDIGFYVPYGDIEATVAGIKKALNTNEKRREAARERIKKNFTVQRREKELMNHIKELIKRSKVSD